MEPIKNVNFYGLKLSIFSTDQLLAFIEMAIINKQKKVCYGYNFGMFPYFKKYPEIPQYANQFDVSVADGRGYYLLAKILGFPVQSDISIPYLVERVLELADKNKFSVMLLGAKEEINRKACVNLQDKHPQARILPGKNGYFRENEEHEVVELINAHHPDILLIGISSPKKERFAHKYKEELNAKIIIPCGGVIDILAGHKKHTPKFIKKIGLAWFYRFVQEPVRLFRDSIINLGSVLFGLIPVLLFKRYILKKKDFSIPDFYKKGTIAPISGLDDL